MKNVKLFEEFLFSEPDDDIINGLIKDIKDENYGEIHGPYNARMSDTVYETEIDGKKLVVEEDYDNIGGGYHVSYDRKNLVCSNSKMRKLHKLMAIDTKGKRRLR